VSKPDLLAPGNRVVSLRSPDSHLDLTYPERRVAGDPAQPDVFEHFELSGTSMAAPMVAATAVLMVQQEPSLTPDSVKARLMISATKASVADPFTTGAGALDVLGALRSFAYVSAAPSPAVLPDLESGDFGIENTAVLWPDSAVTTPDLWADAVLWPDLVDPWAPVIPTTAVLWPDLTTPYPRLWPDTLPEAVLWPDTVLWSEAVLWPDTMPQDDVIESQAELVDDP
jgi:serine protease AprX